MKINIYFDQFKLPHRKNHFWHLIHTSKTGKLYYIHTSGVVGVVHKNGKETLLKGCLHHNKDLVVKIDSKTVKVKNLVAKEIFSNYIEGEHSVVLLDGNPRNCDCYNMAIFTKKQLGELTGFNAGKNQKIKIDGVVYQSIRQAAKANFVSYQTVIDYLSGKYKKSILADKKIKIVRDK